jgi:hypothetical protein
MPRLPKVVAGGLYELDGSGLVIVAGATRVSSVRISGYPRTRISLTVGDLWP